MKVALFATCIGDTLFPEAARGCVEVLERLGHEIAFPADQTCCGQMHLNSGYREEAARLAQRFGRVFAGYDVVVSPSSSCVGTLREVYGFGNVFELSELLVHRLGVADVGAVFPHRVAYHPTCHSLRVTRVGDAPLRLLGNVRGLELAELADAEECCGFGGTFAVGEEAVSCLMGRDRIQDHARAGAEVIAGFDMSCLMHLDGLIRRAGQPQRVMHVAEILEKAKLS
jgi:L-lactate dehydrogenase complex protein LldE